MPIVGVDLGTTGARACVFSDTFAVLSQAYFEYPLVCAREGFAEQEADDWWCYSAKAVKSAVEKSGLSIESVTAIGISTQGISFVPVDRAFRPLCGAISWLDLRAGEQADEIAEQFGEEKIYSITGKRISRAYTLPKLMWLRKNCTEVWEKAAFFLLPHDFLAAKMTGIPATDTSMAAGTLLYDIADEKWSQELLDIAGLASNRMPAVVSAGSVIGRLLPDAAGEMGLCGGIPVVAGGQDQKCAALAAGLEQGTATLSMGTAAALSIYGPKDGKTKIPVFPYLDGRLIREGVVGTAAVAFRWYRDTFAPESSYAELDEMAAEFECGGHVIFLPYLSSDASGESLWKSGRGVFLGLGLDVNRGEVAHAILEGVAFAVRDVLESMGTQEAGKIRIFGGGAASDLWCRMIAGATGKITERLAGHEMTVLGAARLAALAAGLYTEHSLPGSDVTAVFTPVIGEVGYYDRRYGDFLDMKEKLAI